MIKIGDVVKIQYNKAPSWNGIEFRVTKVRKPKDRIYSVYYEGTITYSPPDRATVNRVGDTFQWGSDKGLIVVKAANTPNAEYMNHIYERIAATVSRDEMRILGARLQAGADR